MSVSAALTRSARNVCPLAAVIYLSDFDVGNKKSLHAIEFGRVANAPGLVNFGCCNLIYRILTLH